MGWVTGYPVRVGLTRKNSDWVDQPVFALGKKNLKKKKFEFGSSRVKKL